MNMIQSTRLVENGDRIVHCDGGAALKITDLKLYYVPMRFLYLKVETDEGISGWGEPLVEGRAATLEAAVNEWRKELIGRDPLKVEQIWQTMYRGAFYRGGAVMMSAISGVDQALWDIRGKYYGMPVYRMLNGGVKEKVMVYRSVTDGTMEEQIADAKLLKAQGYRTLKTSPQQAMHYIDSYQKVEEVVRRVTTLRETVGSDVNIAIDFHGRIHRPMAKQLARALDPLHLTFLEEPVLPENNETLDELRQYTATPVATGERMYNRWDFKGLLASGRADILQPDLSHAGGISEGYRIAAMAEAYDCAMAPHCPLSAIAFAACLQLDAAAPNSVFQEQSVGVHDCTRNNPLLRWIKNPEVFAYSDGFVRVPQGPGLGIEVDEELVAEASRTPHDWKNPLWFTYDGTPIEW